MKKLQLLCYTLLALILIASCQKDEANILQMEEEPASPALGTYPGVDSRLWVYFQRFEEEGRLRGLNINLAATGITGVIEEIAQEHVAGQCNFSNRNPNHVIVDLEFWNRSSDLFKEFIIFHELGHCYLFRGHREDAFANGVCVSIMRSGTEDCRDAYRNATRDIYLDELYESEN